MSWTITYYDDSVQEEILAMPPGFLGRYLPRELEKARRRMKEIKNAHS